MNKKLALILMVGMAFFSYTKTREYMAAKQAQTVQGISQEQAADASKDYLIRCASCHNSDGTGSVGTETIIAGKTKEEVVQSLMAYKNDENKNEIMHNLMQNTSEEEINELANEISGF